MKGLQILASGAVAVLAKEAIPHRVVDYGLAKIQELLGVVSSPPIVTEAPTRTLENLGIDYYDMAAQLWPFSTPCVYNVNETRNFCVYSNPDFANGRGISVLTSPDRAVGIAQSRALADPSVFANMRDLNAPDSPRWRVEAIPGKDYGLVATRNLEIGEHIMSTTASLMIDYNVFYELLEEDVHAMQVEAVNYFPPKHRSLFMNLSTHDEVDGIEERVDKIILTNSFDIADTDVLPEELQQDNNFYTVFPDISRLNHDCRPNADYYFDPESMTQHIHVVRPIAAGEEITISYINTYQTREERLARLDLSWHFSCSCSLCTLDDHQAAASDARLRQITEIRSQLSDWEPSSPATPAMAELLISLYEQERLWLTIYEAYAFAAIEYNGAGEPWLATKYARLAIKHGLAASGPGDYDVNEMKALAKDPWAHWSWMTRTRRRMNWVSNVDE
ncbi:hypothetical protein BX600DRAFT_547574 [Xylariales sp. PMI_506]|nr:hypothetical protein BX600DRAFT_547574 [Xylariales sp. PMI_506]